MSQKTQLKKKLLVSNAVGIPVHSFLGMGAAAIAGVLAGGLVVGLVKGLWGDQEKS